MPTRAPRACPQCKQPIHGTRCTHCYPAWHGSAWRQHNVDERWKRIKKRRTKNNPICQQCGTRPTQEIDHITPLSQGGQFYDYDNTQSLCTTCHDNKTQHEAQHARRTPRIYTTPTHTAAALPPGMQRPQSDSQ